MITAMKANISNSLDNDGCLNGYMGLAFIVCGLGLLLGGGGSLLLRLQTEVREISPVGETDSSRVRTEPATLSYDVPILLLDDATGSLKADTERRLLENLRRMTYKTVVIVTHRPAALTICDRVLQFTENSVTVKTDRCEIAFCGS